MAYVSDFTDNFTRANAGNLGANWTSGYTSANPISISSNLAQATNLGTDAIETVNAVTLVNNQAASVKLTTVTGGVSLLSTSILLRAGAGAAQTWYEFTFRQNSTFTSRIAYRNAGSATSLGTENATTWAAGDILYGEVQGTTLKLFRNGVLLLGPFTDANLSSGRAGLAMTNLSASLSNLQCDDFDCGHFSSGASSLAVLGAG